MRLRLPSFHLRREKSPETKKILFFTPFGLWSVHNQVDVALAQSLRERGADILMVRCTGSLLPCDIVPWSEDKEKECGKCQRVGKSFISKRCPSISMSEALTPQDRERAEKWAEGLAPSEYSKAEWNGLAIGRWSLSSLFTYFRISPERLGEPRVAETHKLFLQNSLLTCWALDQIISDFAPDHAVVFNGRMAPFRAALETFSRHKIPVLLHERGFVDDSFVFGKNVNIVDPRHLRDCFETWKDIPLEPAEARVAAENLRAREQGRQMNYPAFYSYRSEVGDIRSLLNIPATARILGVFTSSEFEMAGVEGFEELARQLDWVDTLIELFRGRDDYLVIRHHPFIYGMSGFPADTNFLRRAREQSRQASANVRILMPTEKINSYALLQQIDGCIAFASTIGMEAAARGIGTACFEMALHSPASGPILRENSPAAIEAIIAQLYKSTADPNADRLKPIYRFVYAMVGRFSVCFKSIGIKNHFDPDERYETARDLKPGNDPQLDRLSDHILRGSPLYAQPGPAERSRSEVAESECLARELQTFAKDRHLNAPSELLRRVKNLRVCRVRCDGVAAASLASCERMHLRLPLAEEKPLSLVSALPTAETPDLFYFAAQDVYFEESFILSAALELASSDKPLLGVAAGCWIEDNGKVQELGTTRAPFPVSLDEWLRTFTAIRAETLLSIFVLTPEGMKSLATRGISKETLFHFLKSPGVVALPTPQLVISNGS